MGGGGGATEGASIGAERPSSTAGTPTSASSASKETGIAGAAGSDSAIGGTP